jgi:hypothetical protein
VRLTRPLTTSLALAATTAFGVSVASAIVGAGPPAAPQILLAEPGSDSVGLTVSDPRGGLDWGVRSYVSTSGNSCVEPGRMSGGHFGQLVGAGQAFRASPAQDGGTCGSLLAEPILLAINHYPRVEDQQPRTVLFGLAGPDVTRIDVGGPGGLRRVGTAPTGAFLLPFAGAVAATDLPVFVTLADGGRLTFDWR